MAWHSISGKAPLLNVSYKPQKISPKSQGTVRMLLHEKIRDAYVHPQFVTDVIKPLQIEQLFAQEVKYWIYNVSGLIVVIGLTHHPTEMVYDRRAYVYFPTLINQVQNLSGGELQRVAITLCLGKPADVYLIDEPSAYLDSEQRLHAAKVIKR